MPAYRELHYCHCIDRRKRYIHWLMVGVVAHQFDASFLFGPVGILHRQILVSVDHERNQVYFPVNNALEAVISLYPMMSPDFSMVHTVPVDVDRPVAGGYVRNPYFPQGILVLVGEQRLQVCRRRDVV